MKKTIVMQVLIFVIAWFVMTPDVLEDNTHLFGLFGSYDIIPGNTQWIMLGAAILSVLNIWFWWPKAQVTSTGGEAPATAESTKSAKADKEIDLDPKTPDLS